jgi:hypothetical protein
VSTPFSSFGGLAADRQDDVKAVVAVIIWALSLQARIWADF